MHFGFVTSAPLRLGGGSRGCTCTTRPRTVPKATTEEWGTPTDWQTSGNGISQKGIQEIEFTIRQNGIIEEKVTGVRGMDCIKLTAEIEKALGKVIHTEKTEEFYEEVVETNPNKQVIQPGDALYVDDPDIPSW